MPLGLGLKMRVITSGSTPAPVITGVSAAIGPLSGGLTVTITGTHLTSASSVTFGGTSATILTNTATQITCTSPAHAGGVVDVVVTTAGGPSTGGTGAYRYWDWSQVTGSTSPSATVVSWYRSDLGVSHSGGFATGIADQIGTNNGTQANANLQPAYNTGGPGVASLDFTTAPAGSVMALLSGGSFTLTNPYTLIAVVTSTTASEPQNGFIVDFAPGTTAALFQSSGTQTVSQYSSGQGGSAAFPALSTPFVEVGIFNGASSSVSVNAGTPATGSVPGGGPSASAITIGNYAGGGGNSIQGLWYEQVVIEGTLSAGDVSLSQAYFTAIYGVA